MITDKASSTRTASFVVGGKTYPCVWQPSATRLLRPTWVEINSRSFKKNLKKILNCIKPRTKLIAVVKANAYGHISAHLSEIALKNGAWALGVSSIEEGVSLRESGINGMVLILGSIYPLENLKIAVEYNLVPTISSLGGIAALSKLAMKRKKNLSFHLKIDTGMGRIGVSVDTAPALFEKIVARKEIVMEGMYTHFACAGNDDKFTKLQMKKFLEAVKSARSLGMKFIAHASNSAALFKNKYYHLDAVRPGLSLYGLKPFKGADKIIRLDPVLSLKTRIVFIKRVPAGSTVSYGASFITKKRSVIATLPIGYADGYNRLLSSNGDALVRGIRCPVAGNVTMDMIMVDVTNVPGVSIGDEVVLIGRQGNENIAVEEIAEKTGTINYEVTCSLGARVPRIMIN